MNTNYNKKDTSPITGNLRDSRVSIYLKISRQYEITMFGQWMKSKTSLAFAKTFKNWFVSGCWSGQSFELQQRSGLSIVRWPTSEAGTSRFGLQYSSWDTACDVIHLEWRHQGYRTHCQPTNRHVNLCDIKKNKKTKQKTLVFWYQNSIDDCEWKIYLIGSCDPV